MDETRKTSEIAVGIIGTGRWGSNILRNLISMKDVRIVSAADINDRRLAETAGYCTAVKTTTDIESVVKDTNIDSVIIATPLSSHFHLAKTALENCKHVFVEKPMASSSEECLELIDIAERNRKILFVGHTFMYNVGIRESKNYIRKKELGKIYFLDARRTNLGPVRSDASALWDLGSHDISIFLFLVAEKPVAVTACGGCFLNRNIEDAVYATLFFEGGIVAHLQASWLNPRKIREITVVGEKKMLVWNDMNISEPLRIYDRGVEKIEDQPQNIADFHFSVREGSVLIPGIQLEEPLSVECRHFIDCVKNQAKPVTDGILGLKVVKILEAATKSMKNQSRTEIITG
jgi:predicted dehydrogenase